MRACSLLLAVLLGTGLAGCQNSAHGNPPTKTATPPLDPQVARAAGLSEPQVSEATRLYTAKCIRCHRAYAPSAYTQVQWNAWMQKMSRKAQLSRAQEDLLSRYLEARRSQPAAGESRTGQPEAGR